MDASDPCDIRPRVNGLALVWSGGEYSRVWGWCLREVGWGGVAGARGGVYV